MLRCGGQKEGLRSLLTHDAHALLAALSKYYLEHIIIGSKLYSCTDWDEFVFMMWTISNQQAKFGSAVLCCSMSSCGK